MRLSGLKEMVDTGAEEPTAEEEGTLVEDEVAEGRREEKDEEEAVAVWVTIWASPEAPIPAAVANIVWQI